MHQKFTLQFQVFGKLSHEENKCCCHYINASAQNFPAMTVFGKKEKRYF